MLLAAGALAALLASACTAGTQATGNSGLYMPIVRDDRPSLSAHSVGEAARTREQTTAATLNDATFTPPLAVATPPLATATPSLAAATPSQEVANLTASPTVQVESAPVPPIAPPRTGMLVAAKNPSNDADPALLPTPTATPAAPKTFSGVLALEPAPTDVTPAAIPSVLPPPPLLPAFVETPEPEDLAPARNNPPLASTANGPAFDWSTSENFLLLATDRREGENSWRTDSIMIIGLDRENMRAAVFSIPRDLYINIPDYGNGRINQADFIGEQRTPGGGPALLNDILEDLLGVRTSHWVRIQMDGFISFVDAMGGLTVYLDCPFSEPIVNSTGDGWNAFRLPAGENLLDGKTAYYFARLRYNESDIGRSRRQRALLWALRDQVMSTNLLPRLPEIYLAFQDMISTDLTVLDMISLASIGLELKPANVRAGGLTLNDLSNYVTPNGAQVLIVTDQEYVRNIFNSVWDQPAMADAYRASAAGCSTTPTEVTADANTDADTEVSAEVSTEVTADITGDPASGTLTATTGVTVSTEITVPETAGEGDGS